VSNPRNLPADSDRGADPAAGLAREYLRTLRGIRDYKIGLAYERRRQGLKSEIEFRETAALEWAIAIVERSIPELAAGR